MTKTEVEDHKAVASTMDWDDLASTIIDIESELYNLEEYLTKKEIKKYCKLLKIYEEEKEKRVQEQSSGCGFGGFIYGQDYATYWNDEE